MYSFPMAIMLLLLPLCVCYSHCLFSCYSHRAPATAIVRPLLPLCARYCRCAPATTAVRPLLPLCACYCHCAPAAATNDAATAIPEVRGQGGAQHEPWLKDLAA